MNEQPTYLGTMVQEYSVKHARLQFRVIFRAWGFASALDLSLGHFPGDSDLLAQEFEFSLHRVSHFLSLVIRCLCRHCRMECVMGYISCEVECNKYCESPTMCQILPYVLNI